jgi:transcriptional regulator with XRE-family HTH domain
MKEIQETDSFTKSRHLEKDKEITKLLGDEIVNNRLLKNLTQKELGNLLGLSVQQIQKYEYGETNISIYRLIEIADVLNISMLNLLTPALRTYYQSQEKEEHTLTDPVEIEIIGKINKLNESKKQALLSLLSD